MLKIQAVATVYYTCTLSDKDEKKVINFIKENPDKFEFMDEKHAIIEAVEKLWKHDEIELYDSAIESDFMTNEINWSEYERRRPEEILGE